MRGTEKEMELDHQGRDREWCDHKPKNCWSRWELKEARSTYILKPFGGTVALQHLVFRLLPSLLSTFPVSWQERRLFCVCSFFFHLLLQVNFPPLSALPCALGSWPIWTASYSNPMMVHMRSKLTFPGRGWSLSEKSFSVSHSLKVILCLWTGGIRAKEWQSLANKKVLFEYNHTLFFHVYYQGC